MLSLSHAPKLCLNRPALQASTSILSEVRSQAKAPALKFGHLPSQADIATQVQSVIAALSPEESSQLETFFRFSLQHKGIGFVAMGQKPIAWLTSFRSDFFNGLESWRRLQEQLPAMKGLTLSQYYSPISPEIKHFLFINDQTLLKTVQTHLDDFKAVLGPEITPEKVLSGFKGNTLITRQVFDNALLLGIVLGYGKHNAQMYQRREQLTYTMLPKHLGNGEYLNRRIARPGIEPSPGYSTPQAELNDICKKFGDDQALYGKPFDVPEDEVQLPSFFCDSTHPESIQMMARYQQEQKRIREFLSDPSPLLPRWLTLLATGPEQPESLNLFV